MKKHIFTVLLAFAFGIGLTLLASTGAMALHKGLTGTLTCGGCHTMHNSQGNATMGGAGTTGNFRLIKGAGATSSPTTTLCLACHGEGGGSGGTEFNSGTLATTPPKVYRTTAWTTTDPIDFSAVGAGGDFSYVGNYNGTAWTLGDGVTSQGKGHSLELATAVPPGNTVNGNSVAATAIGTLSCTSCHDAHGTASTSATINKFRNLKASTANAGLNQWTDMATFGDIANSYVGAVAASTSGGTNPTLQNNVWPVYRSGTSQNVYVYKAVATTSVTTDVSAAANNNVGMSAFCAQCHGAWHEGLVDGGMAGGSTANNVNGSDWNRHPVNNLLQDSTTTSGSGTTILDTTNYGAAGVALPTANAAASTRYYVDTNATSKVFCLSCHFAHGGPNYDALRWNHMASAGSGTQDSLGMASNVGCQQCHNR